MSAAAVDVPTVYDVVINGVGFMLDKRREDQALLGHTPTFVPRNNTSGAYGDNEQDFFLTTTQKDWSGGEDQRHWAPEEDRMNRFWASDGIDVATVGQFSLLATMRTSTTPAGGVQAAVAAVATHYLAGTTNLFTATSSGTIDQGAHGAGQPCKFGVCWDGVAVYIAGATSIRRWDGTTYTTFSTQANAGSLAYLNNQLYSCDSNKLRVYSASGVPTDVYTWTDAKGVPYPNDAYTTTPKPKLLTYGATLLIYFTRVGATRPELWMYDGDSTFRVAQLPIGIAGDAIESNGIVFLSTAESSESTETSWTAPGGVIYVWVNGSIQEVFREDAPGGGVTPPIPIQMPALGLLSGSVVFTTFTATGTRLKRYILETGAVESMGVVNLPNLQNASRIQISSGIGSVCLSADTSNGYVFFPNVIDGSVAHQGYLDSSMYDFSSSLKKMFRSITVDFDNPSGGSVDIAYRVDGDVIDNYVVLVTGAVSGQEYLLSTANTGRTIQVRVTLHASGISSASPIVRRVYVRAAPFQQAFRKAIYHLDLSSFRGRTPIMHRDGTAEARSGKDYATLLYGLVTSQTIVPVIDALGTYQGILDPEGFQITQFNPDEFLATVAVREV